MIIAKSEKEKKTAKTCKWRASKNMYEILVLRGVRVVNYKRVQEEVCAV